MILITMTGQFNAANIMDARTEELTARALLADPGQINLCWHEKRWAELAVVVRFAKRGVPVERAQTDAALYRLLREQITHFYLRGGDVFALEKLGQLARG